MGTFWEKVPESEKVPEMVCDGLKMCFAPYLAMGRSFGRGARRRADFRVICSNLMDISKGEILWARRLAPRRFRLRSGLFVCKKSPKGVRVKSHNFDVL